MDEHVAGAMGVIASLAPAGQVTNLRVSLEYDESGCQTVSTFDHDLPWLSDAPRCDGSDTALGNREWLEPDDLVGMLSEMMVSPFGDRRLLGKQDDLSPFVCQCFTHLQDREGPSGISPASAFVLVAATRALAAPSTTSCT